MALAAEPPQRPTGLTTAAGNGQVTLFWTNPDDALVERRQLSHLAHADSPSFHPKTPPTYSPPDHLLSRWSDTSCPPVRPISP